MEKNVLFISEKTIKDTGLLDENLSNSYIRPVLKYVQDESMSRILGQEFYEDIQKKIEDSDVSSEYEILLNFYIKDVLLWYVMAEIQIPLSAKFRNMGMTVGSDEQVNNLFINEIKYTKNQYRLKATFYENRLNKFLFDNAKEYPLFKKCRNNRYNTQIYLD